MGLLFLVDVPVIGETIYHWSNQNVLSNETEGYRVGDMETPEACAELFTQYLGAEILEVVSCRC